jgi:AcrR family transcriptional regulator
LAPETVVDVAVALIEERGLREVTMAEVARVLEVPVTSVHWHFRTRDDLIDAVAERVTNSFYAALPPVASGGTWDEELLTYFAAMRKQLLVQRSFLELTLDRGGKLFERSVIRRTITERLEGEVSILVRAGVEASDAYRLYNVCSNYVRGFVLLELDHTRPSRPVTDDDRQFLDPAVFPVMSQVPDLGALSWQDADHQFELGLELIVSGIRGWVEERLG